jgi:hypothetical protein
MGWYGLDWDKLRALVNAIIYHRFNKMLGSSSVAGHGGLYIYIYIYINSRNMMKTGRNFVFWREGLFF